MNNRVIAIAGTLLGTAAGVVAGYFVARYRLEAKYAQFASDEIETAREYMKVLYKQEDNATPEQVLAKRRPTKPENASDEKVVGPPTEVLERVIEGLRYGKPGVVVNEPVKKNDKNVFEDQVDSDDEETEETDSDDKVIHIISFAEFNANETSYEQVTLTYFAGDDVLVEEDEIPIEDVDAVVGNANLDRFGYKSRDAKIVYVRNNRLQIDYCICKSEGSYAEEVAGFKAPKARRVDRFRE